MLKRLEGFVSQGEIIERAVNMQVHNINRFLIAEKQFLELEPVNHMSTTIAILNSLLGSLTSFASLF